MKKQKNRKKNKEKYSYFVSFQYKLGTGNHEILIDKPIKSLKDINLLQNLIEKEYGISGVIILYFYLWEIIGGEKWK